MLFVASPKYSHYIIIGAAGVSLIFAYLFLGSGFRSERVDAWMDPESYASGKGYQTLQALYAIGSGGLTGKGRSYGTYFHSGCAEYSGCYQCSAEYRYYPSVY